MAALSAAVRGLSTEELETIRDGLANGRKPRVVFTESAGQVAGEFGHVIELTDPGLSDEWVVVRFGKDELPFSPADLAIPPRGTPARRAAAPAKDEPELRLTEPPVPPLLLSTEEQMMPTKSQFPAAKPAADDSTLSSSAASAEAPVASSGAVPAPRKAGRPPKVKGPAGLTVTVAYADGEWTVAASQGTKTVAKPYVIKPTDALKMVGLLDVAAVQEAVEQIVAAERAEAEQQAEKLRAELAELEAKLADLRDSE